jgi:ribosomal protein L23
MRRSPGRRRTMGLTRSWKKAIVTLKPGHRIELYEGV